VSLSAADAHQTRIEVPALDSVGVGLDSMLPPIVAVRASVGVGLVSVILAEIEKVSTAVGVGFVSGPTMVIVPMVSFNSE